MGSARAGAGEFDVAIVGAGAAGMYCAAHAGTLGARVLLIDHAQRLGEKIRISGGGRCNFTNVDAADFTRYVGQDSRFARFALLEHGPQRFIEALQSERIGFHEKHRGQLFCDESAEQIVALLVRRCEAAGVAWRFPAKVTDLTQERGGFHLATTAGEFWSRRVVVATGGLPVPKIGASDWGLVLARRFGHAVVEPKPALVPLSFAPEQWAALAALAGVSLEVRIAVAPPDTPAAAAVSARRGSRPSASKPAFLEDLLFTHRGLSGPAVLQASSFWTAGEALQIDLTPGLALAEALRTAKSGGRRALATVLAEHLPRRLAHDGFSAVTGEDPAMGGQRIADCSDRLLKSVAEHFQNWRVVPNGTEGWRKAEVMRGGVSTRELDPRSLESRRVPGLHFIGEVVDITGWLGGYNFQWAWSSAAVCAQAIAARAA
jgi:predicted Rossmann fold flavoprotein